MLAICVSGLLVVSIAVSALLWLVLVTAKQADRSSHGIRYPFLVEFEEGQFPLVKPILSGND